MQIHLSIVLAGVMSASLVYTESMTQPDIEKAQAVLDAAVIGPATIVSLVDADPCIRIAGN